MKTLVFVFRVWRLGWARMQYQAIGGWKRIWWRLWWDLRIPVQPPEIRWLIPPPKPPEVLHWYRGHSRPHWCGASFGEPYTIFFQDSTCKACRVAGLPTQLQYETNTR